MVEARVATDKMRESIQLLERRLSQERQAQADAERRGKLAEEIGDTQTVEVARDFAGKHAEKAAVLERRLEAQKAELGLAERELQEMKEKFQQFDRGQLGPETTRSAEAAWESITSAGGSRPETDQGGERLKSELDLKARSEQVEEPLRALKKKLGK